MRRRILLMSMLAVLLPSISFAVDFPGQVETTTPSFNNKEKHPLTLDAAGNLKTVMGPPSGVTGTATAAAPTLAEGSTGYFSWDLSGNLRVTLGTLISGEDQNNDLLMTSGGVTRQTTFAGVAAAATDSAITTVFNGPKTFQAYMGGASETKAFDITIKGNWQNSVTGARNVCRIWQPSTASVTHIEGDCTVNVNYPYWFFSTDSGATGYTSASGAQVIVYAHN